VKDGPFLERIGLPHLIHKKRAIGVYHTTGFSRDEVVDLCVLINSAERVPGTLKWPPILGLFRSVTVTLAYLRHNRTQAEIGESFGVSQPTISRAISAITPFIAEGLAGQVPTADELDPGTQYIVDGTLLPCWSWASHPELYSGKHKTTGMNIQLACTIHGQLAWISDPVNGAVAIQQASECYCWLSSRCRGVNDTPAAGLLIAGAGVARIACCARCARCPVCRGTRLPSA
jgi:hypothetical protein